MPKTRRTRARTMEDHVLHPENYEYIAAPVKDKHGNIKYDKYGMPKIRPVLVRRRVSVSPEPDVSYHSQLPQDMEFETVTDDIDEEAAALESAEVRRQELRSKRETLRRSWKTQLGVLAEAYIESHADGSGPQYTANSAPGPHCCTCDGPKVRKSIDCVYLTGIRKEEFVFCNGQNCAPVTLMRHHLLAASPKRPAMAFHLSLMEFYSVLRVEGHTAVQAFSNTLAQVHKYLKADTLRKNMGLAFFIYRELLDLVLVRLAHKAPVLKDRGCPCCVDDKLIVAMDGNFQLKRRKADKEDKEKAMHPSFFRANHRQSIYDRADLEVADADTPSDGKCSSNFKAEETAMTSRSRNQFHETGLFGSACARHGIPLEFTDIYESGEKFKYPLAILNVLTEQYGNNIGVMYDIACRFKSKMHREFPALQESQGTVAIGVFHAYAHSVECQVEYNPRYLHGLGLTDGEGMERLWSYLGRFVPITRQMTAQNRVMTLCHALEHFRSSRINTLSLTLARREKNAHKLKHEAELYVRLNGLSDEELGEQWRHFVRQIRGEEAEFSSGLAGEAARRRAMAIRYVEELTELYAAIEESEKFRSKLFGLQGSPPQEILDVLSQIPSFNKSYDKALKDVERCERVLGVLSPADRWQKHDARFMEARLWKSERDRDIAQSKLRPLVISRMLLQDFLRREGKLAELARAYTKSR
ncbi:hypothetical protein BCR43DRAFT_346228 [Syncephalastrum racemosum]|uniref:CxC1-like cysteine cluster associated with KDZ transposases domain-containing protein n=1 Tax=Syncephalastrum racemosum TaxID=13706 RepID=A0A1X2H5X5_SYNRA|nr:hypothetical protein BCR43DRAFT_346228 [Syncephalastrum racemosum]